ncbi:MAG: type II toxin-antitoxin system VapC family toxin [Chitinophagales bacterium]|nr:type II toxin-antitoxin system VapC family toxin [Chitinophagales bacterium]
MNYFIDTSALVKYFHEESGSDKVRKIMERAGNKVWVSEISTLEFASALYRKFRNGEIKDNELKRALEGFEEELATMNVTPFGTLIIEEAKKLLATHGKQRGLRTLDALQLGAFGMNAERDWTFVVSDENLSVVAKACGFKVMKIT